MNVPWSTTIYASGLEKYTRETCTSITKSQSRADTGERSRTCTEIQSNSSRSHSVTQRKTREDEREKRTRIQTRDQAQTQLIVSRPAERSLRASKAASDISILWALLQVGHSSATTAVTDFPLAVLVIVTLLPQMLWL